MSYQWIPNPIGLKQMQSTVCTLLWRAPPDGPVASAPFIALDYQTNNSGSQVAAQMTAIGGATTISSASGRTITLSSDVSGDYEGVQGDSFGHAFVKDPGGAGTFPVKVQSFNGAVVTLADMLPARISDLTASATLDFDIFYYQASIANSASLERDIQVAVLYTVSWGNDAQTDARRHNTLLHVVNVPFDTGLRDEDVFALDSSIAQLVARRSDSIAPQIRATLEGIVRRIRIAGYVEDTLSGFDWLECHRYLTAAMVLAGSDPDLSATFREMGEAECARVLERVSWSDEDNDGVVDDGETAVRKSSPGANAVSGRFSESTYAYADSADIPFTRGMDH